MTFLTVCLNPTLQKTLYFSSIKTGSVNRTAIHRLDVSGKGINVTRVLTQLGKKAVHLTHLGDGMSAGLRPLFLSLCEQDGLSVEWVESKSQIRFCYTVINENSGEVTELIEEPEPVSVETEVSAGTEQRLLEKFETLIGGESSLKYVIISGTKAAGYSDMTIPYMAKKAKEKGLYIILDIKGKDLTESLKYKPDIIKPNLDEFTQTFGLEVDNAAGLRELMIDIAQKYRCHIILTNGSRKILAATASGTVCGDKYFEIEIQPVKAVNTTGCGDAFTAGLAAALDDGADFNSAINEGIRCGALNAGLIKPGVIK